MAFKEVNDLSCDTTISLGGFNKKERKDNPTTITGYYLGSRTVADAKKKSGISYIYAFQTPKGNIGVWGKTDMDRKMEAAPVGALIRVSFDKMRPCPNGEMYVYKVEVDADNTIEVAQPAAKAYEASSADPHSGPDVDEEYEETDLGDEEPVLDEVPLARPVAAKKPAATPNANRVQELLNRRKQA